MNFFKPDFDEDCRICGTTPTVVVVGHKQPDTELCGVHFFNSLKMRDWENWNDKQDPQE